MSVRTNMSRYSLNDNDADASFDYDNRMTAEQDSCYFESFLMFRTKMKPTISVNDLLSAMRTAGANPTESELQVNCLINMC